MSTAENLSILFVDDQPVLLKMLCNLLDHKAPIWRIRTANNGEEALRLLDQEHTDIIVSDMSMPGMNGMGLLETVKQVHPKLLRFILSGQSCKSEILSSVGIVHQLLSKPIQIDELVDSLDLSRTLYQKIQDPELQQLISNVGTLPVPRDVYFKVGRMLNDPDSDLSDIGDAISQDAAISAKVLQLVNSAFFSRGGNIDSIQNAVSMLGINNVRSLILIIGIVADQHDALDRVFSIDSFSRQSLEVAQMCRWFGKQMRLKREQQDALFTAGLLHGVGKMVLVDQHQEFYLERGLKENAFSSKMCFQHKGRKTYDHSLVGAALLALWGLPSRIINAVAFHLEPENAPDSLSNQALIVHVAQGLVNYKHAENQNESLFDSGFIDTKFIDELNMRSEIEAWIEEWEFENN